MANITRNQQGNTSVILLVVFVILFVAAASFGIWAFSGQQNYKNNVDSIVAKNVDTAVASQKTKDATTLAEALKYPLQTYSGPSQFGSMKLLFPKTWSAYIDETGNNDAIGGYFSPNFVPAINADSSVFALRIQVVKQTYTNVIQNFQGLVQSKKITAAAYSLPKQPEVLGTELTGQISSTKNGNGIMVVIPDRQNTIEISTYGTNYVNDFNNIILKNFSFTP